MRLILKQGHVLITHIHTLNSDALKVIMAAMQPPRSKNFIIEHMIRLGLIADRSEILPSQRRRAKKSKSAASGSESQGSDADAEHAEYGEGQAKFTTKNIPATKRKASTKKPLNYVQISTHITELELNYQAVLVWLEESLNDAAEDLINDGPAADPDDCVPLVPFTGDQREAMECTEFQALLIELGLQPPSAGAETYWRIPQHLSADEITLRARMVSGAFDFDAHRSDDMTEAVSNDNDGSDADSEEDYDFEANRLKMQRQQRAIDLVYTNSDDEAIEPPASKSRKQKPDALDMVHQPEEEQTDVTAGTSSAANDAEIVRPNHNITRIEDSSDEDAAVSWTRKPKRNVLSDSDDDDNNKTVIAPNQRSVSRNKRERSQDDSGSGSETSNATVIRTATKRKRTAAIEDDDDDE